MGDTIEKPKTAKLFTNGRSQAVRLPKEFRFEGDEVLIEKDETTGKVILSPKEPVRDDNNGWGDFFELARQMKPGDIPDDFLCEEDRILGKDGDLRDPFEGWKE